MTPVAALTAPFHQVGLKSLDKQKKIVTKINHDSQVFDQEDGE